MELTLGPVLFEWKRDELLRFYDQAASMDLDAVYLGEVVCTKKLGLKITDIESIAGALASSGKRVVLSSLAVVSNEEELEFTRALVNLPYPLEANDMSVFNMAEPSSREVVAGPHITTYNVPSMKFLKTVGVKRVVFPVELSRESMAYNIKETGMEGEVFANGKVPLAFSWRCYTSRAYGLTKTGCKHHCALYPDGMELKSVDGTPLFTVNGTSLLSAGVYTLIEYVEELKETGAKALRISPQHRGTDKVVEAFRKRLDGELGPGEGLRRIREASGEVLSNGWFLGGAGKDYIAKTIKA